MRHGEAGHGWPDRERELTSHGHEEARRMADWVARQPSDGVRLYASPYRRARQTAAHLAAALGAEPVESPLITPDDSPSEVCDWLLGEGAGPPVILVSHMPLVGLLTGLLVDGRSDHGLAFPTAAIAELESEVWAAGCARLLRFTTPSDIR
ncbi:MAG: histidine phosphatase family protein [Halomonas sp.]|nr:histidine phosphatase family protein [Halomonas sp.]MCC5881092.1 histidine phosphatase family protein [Halomonas sp.]